MPQNIKYALSTSNLHIEDSYKVPAIDFREVLRYISDENPNAILFKARCIFGMQLEWAVHNFLYKIGFQRDRTRDVDLDYPQKWYYSVGYFLCGLLVYPILWFSND